MPILDGYQVRFYRIITIQTAKMLREMNGTGQIDLTLTKIFAISAVAKT